MATKYSRQADVNNIFQQLDRAILAEDVVEVVRCKDCIHRPIVIDASKHYGFGITAPKENGYADFSCPYLCDDMYYNRMPKDDWYCSDGERMADNGQMRR